MAKTKNGKKRGKMGAVKRGRPRLEGVEREPNGRPRRGAARYAGGGRERPVGATPEQALRRIATGMLAAGLPGRDGRTRGGLDGGNCPLDWLHAAGVIDDAAYQVMMRWRELHRRIIGAPDPASRDRVGSAAEVTPEMQRDWRHLSEAMTTRERECVFAIAVQECWPGWLLARDGWGEEHEATTADGKRCHLFRSGVARLVEAEAEPLQSLVRRQRRRLTRGARVGNVINGASISGSETDHPDADTPQTAATAAAGR